MTWRILFSDAANRSLRKLPAHIQRRIARWIELLSDDPLRPGTRNLVGHPAIRRVHASKDYVILYTLEHPQHSIVVLRVENRKEVYRGL